MLNYAICEISGKQYKILPNQEVLVDWLGEESKKIEASVLMLSEGGKVKIGTPFLKEKLVLECLGTVKNKKIRVAKFHAKANYRRVRGHRANLSRIVLAS